MEPFILKHGELFAESVPLRDIAKAVGTPTYIYSDSFLKERCEVLKKTFAAYPTLPCYAVKANSNLSVLKTIFAAGFGADIVSQGELERSLLAGAKPSEIVYSGVGKKREEIERALDVGILSFHVESLGELDLIESVAEAKRKTAAISLRINPNIDVKTNPYIATGLYTTKFGITEKELEKALATIEQKKSLRLIGLSCHLGSQITSVKPMREGAKRMAFLAKKVIERGFPLETLDLGGGLGICYKKEKPPAVSDYAKALIAEVKDTKLKLLLEPGRQIVGNSGVLLTTVLNVKKTPKKTFVIVDAGMNDLIRPALYEAYHEIEVGKPKRGAKTITADIVGPICETGDFIALKRKIQSVEPGDLLVVRSAGAYGFSMSSQYNSRPRAAEVLVEKENYKVIRKRETFDSLWNLET